MLAEICPDLSNSRFHRVFSGEFGVSVKSGLGLIFKDLIGFPVKASINIVVYTDPKKLIWIQCLAIIIQKQCLRVFQRDFEASNLADAQPQSVHEREYHLISVSPQIGIGLCLATGRPTARGAQSTPVRTETACAAMYTVQSGHTVARDSACPGYTTTGTGVAEHPPEYHLALRYM